MVVHEEQPYNAESGVAALGAPLTPTDAFYVRSHGDVPDVDPGRWRLVVQGAVERELSLSLATLREAFVEREVTATLQCAGNRRAGLIAIRDIPGEAPWGPGATGTATWTGVALADVLALAAPDRTRGTSGSKVPTSPRRRRPFSASAARSRSTRRPAARCSSRGR